MVVTGGLRAKSILKGKVKCLFRKGTELCQREPYVYLNTQWGHHYWYMHNYSFTRCKMNPSYNDAAMDDRNWHNSKATPEMILKELGMPHKTPIHYDRKKINLQWSQHS